MAFLRRDQGREGVLEAIARRYAFYHLTYTTKRYTLLHSYCCTPLALLCLLHCIIHILATM
ncbi:hypothetical protein BO85DRAFT_196993 [Aspergillus piperis CBS 112811]|uniref:Uncharacterized protein n=1 Tax=Aspergillus piperis CBS 112811 TaxID=1448313 RepID=A0A8G1R8J7_9EURO|nr:hypothetical protein BO85DRAFT_196993 [Aspergillus piperis CBS 112811]RAH61464.1 hypothetical protein BO85DRAFT_196993 [Aspergillus piperis CBS 112811]